MKLPFKTSRAPAVSRRGLLIGGAAGVGLVVAWGLWPRAYQSNLVAAKGEHILSGYIKIGEDGHIIVVVPQAEMGQGSYTLIPQIIADELGADWRAVGVEPAPLNPLYANRLAAIENANGLMTRLFGNAARTVAGELGQRAGLQWTGGSTTVRAFEQQCREAGAAARALLCQAAAKRWEADWRACDTVGGFVVRGDDKLRFGELVREAAAFEVPSPIGLRTGRENRLTGQSIRRLDLPAKVDGSANYAADIRLPDMVFAAIRMGPLGDTYFKGGDEKAALKIKGVEKIVAQDRWVAVIADNWWAANRALDAMNPRFSTQGAFPQTASIAKTLATALDADPTHMYKGGDAATAVAGTKLLQADYFVELAPHAAIEPMAATAAVRDGKLEIWMPTQVPGLAQSAAAKAIGYAKSDVIIHMMMMGGSFGRKYEVEIAAQAAILAEQVKRPVQLIWSRSEDMMQDRFRPAAAARMAARVAPAGQIMTWQSKIAAPYSMAQMQERIVSGQRPHVAQLEAGSMGDPTTVSGAMPPYSIANYAIGHVPAEIGVATGKWRSGADSYTAFFNECFVDELARASGVEPLSFRMALLNGNPRLAQCVSRAAILGGWQGGAEGTNQGMACHAMLGSHVAVVAEAHISDAQRVVVDKLVIVADVGRMVNPDIVRQQIEGGAIFGMAAAIGNRVAIKNGLVSPRDIGGLALPVLANMPEMIIELIPSKLPPGGVGEVAVPPIAPAIANALFAASGRRFRSLPLLPA